MEEANSKTKTKYIKHQYRYQPLMTEHVPRIHAYPKQKLLYNNNNHMTLPLQYSVYVIRIITIVKHRTDQ